MRVNSFAALAAQLGQATIAYRASLVHSLDEIGHDVATEVRSEIGEYQSAIGPFPATEPLADSTIETKSVKGLGKNGDPDTPLYATGAFESDVGHAVNAAGLSVEIGTNQTQIIFTEFGTSKQPPRPIFGPAALRILPKLQGRVMASIAMGMSIGISQPGPGGNQRIT